MELVEELVDEILVARLLMGTLLQLLLREKKLNLLVYDLYSVSQ